MKMEIKVGLIRGKREIREGLLKSKSTAQQLAVCYNSDGKLIVKISVVKDLTRENETDHVILVSPDDEHAETRILLDQIESIYPIRNF